MTDWTAQSVIFFAQILPKTTQATFAKKTSTC